MSISLFSTAGGALLWLAGLIFVALDPIQSLFLLAPLVLVPLGLPLLELPDRRHQSTSLIGWLIRLQPIAAPLLWLSFTQAPGPVAAALAAGWVLLAFACGLAGLLRHLPHGFSDAGEVCLDAALLFLPVGGVWLLASRLGVPLMGFHEPLVLLTAVHFHYAGFCAALLTGLSGRLELPRTPYRLTVIGVLAGIPLLALGIAFAPVLEVLSAAVFALSLATLALLWLRQLPRLRRGRVFLTVASAAILFSMGFALTFALGEFLGRAWVTIPQMARAHGALNALGFALPGLLAFWRLQTVSRLAPRGQPFSQLASKGFVGPGFFQRIGAVPDAPETLPQGLIDDVTSFSRPDFEPERLAGPIRHFYEHTEAYTLFVAPFWQRGFGLGGRIWRALMEKVGQMCLPIAAERRHDRIDSRILPLDPKIDGRPGVRAWVRTY
ncbi:MAG TPA: YndJ family protein, partial [Candidatus Obscuribacterales bacterium]